VPEHLIPLAERPRGDEDDRLSLTFIGTATVLLRVGGFTLLTDPNFLHAGEHAYLGGGIRSKRLLDPAMEIGQLPPLDAVVLSHHHGDHFDRVAAAQLDKDVPIITEGHAARKLRRQGFRRPIALATWEQAVLRRGAQELRVTSMPGRHSPRVLGPIVPPVMGSMLELLDGGAPRLGLYISGDTLLFEGIEQVAARYPRIDVCLVHLGGTRIAGVLLTMDAEQGVQFLRLVDPDVTVPIHTDDYGVFRSPLSDFLAAAEQADLRTTVQVVGRGETWTTDLPR
jgi:L-ascorbate metabolism protein UlaG (beta-lactamase superfamily)